MLMISALFGAFLALKLFLWSLPLTQVTLFAVALPLGVVYFWAVFRLYGRSLTGRPLRPPA